MQTILLGRSQLPCSRLAYGCWRLAGTWNAAEVTPDLEAQGRRAVHAAFEAGYTLFDHADIYCQGVAERIFGAALREDRGMRDRILIATKCGIRAGGDPGPGSPHRYDFSAGHISRSCEQSLRRLGVEIIDLFQLHRPDYLMDPAEVALAFSQLRQAGKVRAFGVSNFRPSQVTALQKACDGPLLVHQVEISLGRLDSFHDGTLDQCLAEQITPLAWSPLARGWLGEGAGVCGVGSGPARLDPVLSVLDDIARERGVQRAVVALAWLCRHPSGIIPIVGSVHPDRIREATQAEGLELTRDEWYRLLLPARGERLP